MNRMQGNIMDIPNRRIYFGELEWEANTITGIRALSDIANSAAPYICPGFVDAHVHIESSMLVPSSFARIAVIHGTIATVSDPHEIANVCGEEGVSYMIENGSQQPFKFHFGVPSCVPATTFETAGAVIDAEGVNRLLGRPDIYYLSEMMNFPGVLHQDPEVMAKLAAAAAHGKPVDGHAPGLRGDAARQYIAAGITTDHECFTYEEALEKLQLGMKILIREGSAARNFEALIPLLEHYPGQMMFCTDDKHPDSLVAGYIDQLCARAVEHEIDVFNVLQAACINPVEHYRLPVGQLREGDRADFIVLEDLLHFKVRETWIEGLQVAANGKTLLKHKAVQPINRFHSRKIPADVFRLTPEQLRKPAIGALDGQLITEKIIHQEPVDPITSGLLPCFVVNRYQDAPPAGCLIANFGLREGAIASSVAHDSHNVIVVGTDESSIALAVNLIMEAGGGISCVNSNEAALLPLPVAGLMSAADGFAVAEDYTRIDRMAKALGSPLSAPFMTLSFMALLVIPHLKLSDRGLFDGDSFTFI
ncbi:adenine deaminase [Flavihumibacter petaseus]|uniref:Adenine deaminase n=1 Tax=Flavihumibacter petaseus NBRC 106054 TaxID=1220578 RepID=A0A0E9MW12_9BACT|nr:adenine deaminase [Flavihumibacter petaseus]GAO41611.1 adenine deaminase [Flavihumibacter petaseus NBRC 106054]